MKNNLKTFPDEKEYHSKPPSMKRTREYYIKDVNKWAKDFEAELLDKQKNMNTMKPLLKYSEGWIQGRMSLIEEILGE